MCAKFRVQKILESWLMVCRAFYCAVKFRLHWIKQSNLPDFESIQCLHILHLAMNVKGLFILLWWWWITAGFIFSMYTNKLLWCPIATSSDEQTEKNSVLCTFAKQLNAIEAESCHFVLAYLQAFVTKKYIVATICTNTKTKKKTFSGSSFFYFEYFY